MPRKIKTKYTLRSDGRICMTEIINGKRKYFYGTSDREVERKRDEYLLSQEQAAIESLKVKHFADIYWAKKEPTLSPNSIGNYRKALERVLNAFGEYPITDLPASEIFAVLSRLSAQDLSARVVGLTRTVLSQIADVAIVSGVLNRNPVNDVPRVKTKAAVPREAATESDIELLERHKNDSLMAAMHYFMLYTGCRRGEAIALQAKHIDRDRRVVHIIQSAAFGAARATIKDPKSASGRRDIPLFDNVLEILPQYSDPETYVFFPDGIPTQKKVEASMKKFQDEIGLSCTAHQLRHAYASMLHSAGNIVDIKSASYLLGHSDISITQNIYTHLEQQHKKALADGLNAFVKGRLK